MIHLKTDKDDSISLTFELEKKLWRNALFEQKGDGMGIFYSRNGIHDLWQVLCTQCAYMTDTGPTVIDEVFTVSFHRRYGNIEALESVNTTDLFDQAKLLASEAIRDYRLGHLFSKNGYILSISWVFHARNEMTSLQEDFILQERYLSKQLQRSFLFSTNHCRTFTGLDLDEITFIHDTYVRHFSWRFRNLNSMEVLNALFVYFKTGESINWIRALIEKITGQTIRNEQLSLAMRKLLFILGKSISNI